MKKKETEQSKNNSNDLHKISYPIRIKNFLEKKWASNTIQIIIAIIYFVTLIQLIKNSHTQNRNIITTFKYAQRIDSINNDTRKKELRAYIAIKSYTIDTFILGKQFALEVTVINTGETPAYKISNICLTILGNGEITTQTIDTVKRPEIGNIFLGTWQPFTFAVICDPIKDRFIFNAIKKKIYKIEFIGRFIYYDVFGDKHFTQYCVRYSPTIPKGEFRVNDKCTYAN